MSLIPEAQQALVTIGGTLAVCIAVVIWLDRLAQTIKRL